MLGYALNDSGIAIPALMLLVLECAAAYVVAARLDEPVVPAPAAVTEPEVLTERKPKEEDAGDEGKKAKK